MLTLYTCITAAAVIVFVYVFQKIWKIVAGILKARKDLIGVFPSKEHHWLLGHLNDFPGSTDESLDWHHELVKKFPRYYVFIVGPLPVLQLNHPETVKIISKTAEPKPTEGIGGYSALLPWLGYGLLTSAGKQWARNRRLLTPGFHFDVLKPYVEIYNDSVEKLMEIFDEKSAKTGNSVEVFSLVQHHAFEVILRCAFSSDQTVQGPKPNEYVTAVSELGCQVVERILNPLYYSDTVFYNTKLGKDFDKNCRLSHGVADGVIKSRRRELTESKETLEKVAQKRYIDFLDILLLAKRRRPEARLSDR